MIWYYDDFSGISTGYDNLVNLINLIVPLSLSCYFLRKKTELLKIFYKIKIITQTEKWKMDDYSDSLQGALNMVSNSFGIIRVFGIDAFAN